MQGDLPAAARARRKVAHPARRGRRPSAKYILARIDLMQKRPDEAIQGFEAALQLSKDPRTLAWSHIYLGRLYDTEATPERDKAIAEYQAALAVRDGRPDTKAAAESGVAHPFRSRSAPSPPPPEAERRLRLRPHRQSRKGLLQTRQAAVAVTIHPQVAALCAKCGLIRYQP